MNELLERLADRLADDPYFLAAPLACFARSERLDDDGLARRLHCPRSELAALRLCRAPRSEPPEAFRRDIEQLAERLDLDRAALAAAVRCGEALLRLRHTDGTSGLLLAARQRRPAEGKPPGEST